MRSYPSDPTPDDERQWVTRARDGDLAAFNAIVERYQQLAYNVALRMLHDPSGAEDATQEAFFSAYRNLAGYRGGSLRSWLLTIVANAARDRLRSTHARRTTSLDAITTAGDPGGYWPSADPSPEMEAERAEDARAIQNALRQLPEDQRLVITLVDLQQLAYEEAANVTGVAVGTVKSRLSRGRDRLRVLLRPRLEPIGVPNRHSGEGA